jgi:valyl-tRNA synthetase
LSEALKTIYSLIWDDFCSWYLEWAKPGFEQPVDPKVYTKTIEFFEKLMELLHPIMPFITEEIFHLLKEQKEDLTVKLQGKPNPADETILAAGSLLKDVITKLRDARNKNQLKPKDPVALHIMAEKTTGYKAIESILMKQVNASNVIYTSTSVANTIVVNIEKDKFFIEAEQQLDTAAIKDRLLKDLVYEQNFLASVMKKLSNEKFVQNAKPEIIALERKKQADAEARINTIEESLKSL